MATGAVAGDSLGAARSGAAFGVAEEDGSVAQRGRGEEGRWEEVAEDVGRILDVWLFRGVVIESVGGLVWI